MDKLIFNEINERARHDEPFVFAISYDGDEAYIRSVSDVDASECLYDFRGFTNYVREEMPESVARDFSWDVTPPSFDAYKRGFGVVRSNILRGDSYLTNLTCEVPVRCNLSLRDIFARAAGKYKLMLGGRFVCFSPEPFVRIRGGRISSFPMKGTAPSISPDSLSQLMANQKEAAEHATIVDLIRNDLSRVASGVKVEKYRYAEVVATNRGPLIQTSSHISGSLPADYRFHTGDILEALLPAGSVTGAPKDKTLDIISQAETYERGFYTGIMGVCARGELDSAVMIRFIEVGEGGELVFKAGGGITSRSECDKEYEEVIQKTYLPIV